MPGAVNVNLHAGGAFAKAMEITRLEYYGNGVSAEVAVARGLKALIEYWGHYETNELLSPKTFTRMAGALEFYFANYPLEFDKIKPVMGANNKPAVEFNFILPLPVNHPQTGEPILYAGRFDMLGQKEGVNFIVDEKTTKQLGESWLKQWRLRSQFTGYCWGAREYGYSVAGFIIRGISILKNSYGTLEAIGYRPDYLVNMWHDQLLRDVRRMIASWQDSFFDRNLADACSAYGGCPYTILCENPNTDAWLGEFEVQPWDPTRVF